MKQAVWSGVLAHHTTVVRGPHWSLKLHVDMVQQVTLEMQATSKHKGALRMTVHAIIVYNIILQPVQPVV